VLASCAPRPGDVAGESRARPFFSGGVGDADAALKRWHCGREVRARTSARLASLRCSSTAPRAPSRQRGREPPGAAKERSLAALFAERLLHRRARRQTTSATEASLANDFCHLLADVVLVEPAPHRGDAAASPHSRDGAEGAGLVQGERSSPRSGRRPWTRSAPKATRSPVRPGPRQSRNRLFEPRASRVLDRLRAGARRL